MCKKRPVSVMIQMAKLFSCLCGMGACASAIVFTDPAPHMRTRSIVIGQPGKRRCVLQKSFIAPKRAVNQMGKKRKCLFSDASSFYEDTV